MPRRRKFENVMTEQVKIRLTPEMMEYAEMLAEQTGGTVPDIFRDLLLKEGDKILSAKDPAVGQPDIIKVKLVDRE